MHVHVLPYFELKISCHNRSILGPYFNEIYLMPETPELAGVNKTLKEHSNAPRRYVIS